MCRRHGSNRNNCGKQTILVLLLMQQEGGRSHQYMLEPRSRLEMVSFWKATAPDVLSQTWWRVPSRLMGSTANHRSTQGATCVLGRDPARRHVKCRTEISLRGAWGHSRTAMPRMLSGRKICTSAHRRQYSGLACKSKEETCHGWEPAGVGREPHLDAQSGEPAQHECIQAGCAHQLSI